MPAKQDRACKVEERRSTVARLYCQGSTQREIAEKVGVSQVQIHKDLVAIRKGWLSSALMDFNERTALELARLDRLESEAWQAFERSKRDLETEVDRVETTTGGDRVITSVSKKQVNPDVRFLETIAKCIELRSKITGILKPGVQVQQTVIAWDQLAVTVNTPSLDTVEQRIQSILNRAPAVIEHVPDNSLLEMKDV